MFKCLLYIIFFKEKAVLGSFSPNIILSILKHHMHVCAVLNMTRTFPPRSQSITVNSRYRVMKCMTQKTQDL